MTCYCLAWQYSKYGKMGTSDSPSVNLICLVSSLIRWNSLTNRWSLLTACVNVNIVSRVTIVVSCMYSCSYMPSVSSTWSFFISPLERPTCLLSVPCQQSMYNVMSQLYVECNSWKRFRRLDMYLVTRGHTRVSHQFQFVLNVYVFEVFVLVSCNSLLYEGGVSTSCHWRWRYKPSFQYWPNDDHALEYHRTC